MAAEMYPLTDYPTYEEEFGSFAEIREQVEDLDEGMNFILSWFIYDEHAEDFRKYARDEAPSFSLLVFMPRLSKTTQFSTEAFDRGEVDAWLNGYVRQRTMRWFGWEQP
ncbi:hypothetical protein [Nocardia asiatica]|uniref:hypothetical protein n=1 Tax=Nocardia asiatica TaxID=209252 RepID=UPI002456AD30|nr:hypothetical protein [Nocardia asiatica]